MSDGSGADAGDQANVSMVSGRGSTATLISLIAAMTQRADLAWMLKHAPDGKVDPLLRTMWAAERAPGVLAQVLERMGLERVVIDLDLHCNPETDYATWILGPCDECCNELRGLVLPPTFEELIALYSEKRQPSY